MYSLISCCYQLIKLEAIFAKSGIFRWVWLLCRSEFFLSVIAEHLFPGNGKIYCCICCKKFLNSVADNVILNGIF